MTTVRLEQIIFHCQQLALKRNDGYCYGFAHYLIYHYLFFYRDNPITATIAIVLQTIIFVQISELYVHILFFSEACGFNICKLCTSRCHVQVIDYFHDFI